MMKLFFGVLMVGTILISCDKDNDDKTKTRNYLKIGDEEYDLSTGILDNYGTDDDNDWHYGYNTDLTLYSKGISLQKDEEGEWELVGKGHGIYFEMFSTTGANLDNGDYELSFTEPFPIGTFDDGEYIINYEPENNNYEDAVDFREGDIVSGKVSVSKSGNEYSITINGTSDKGEKISGFYKGSLRYFDWSDAYKSATLHSKKVKKSRLK